MPRQDIKIPFEAVQQRYGVGPLAVRGWDKHGFPKPMRIRRRLYWSLAELDAWDAHFSDNFGRKAA